MYRGLSQMGSICVEYWKSSPKRTNDQGRRTKTRPFVLGRSSFVIASSRFKSDHYITSPQPFSPSPLARDYPCSHDQSRVGEKSRCEASQPADDCPVSARRESRSYRSASLALERSTRFPCRPPG